MTPHSYGNKTHKSLFVGITVCTPVHEYSFTIPVMETVVIVLLYMLSYEYDSMNCTYLASHVGDQYVPGSQVSVDKSPAREVVETQSHLLGEVQ